ncbi:hypothetical protein HRW12_00350 [Streptomyces lunaelactis]|uniref:hypothetical protein n=1 Tax=Streptomyces lunaelactis TaxID=1535768 RepID=UPI001584EDCD|nr:hypothetical protein [Streptomyces lunaelactis]NUK32248.1 hypothetical protein [Streptomyces lunaelactis]NUK41262.1 hypothetical protein [Streptomyces lunaelactis]
MAEIVGIHGIGQQYSGPYELASAWHDAVRDGLSAAGRQPAAEALSRSDLNVAFFADLFRPPGAMAAQDPHYSAKDVQPGLERDLLAELYRVALEKDPSLAPPKGAMGPGIAVVQIMLRQLLRSRWFPAVAERAFIGDLKQVTLFLTNKATKASVLERLHAKVADDTRVLIGHSLGSVVIYEYLYRFRPASVELCLTLGSPLGIPRLVFDRLTPAPHDGKGEWPGTVPGWVNVADPDDIVALRKDLAILFPGPPPDGSVDDRLVDNGDSPHAINRYLNARETGSALGDVLNPP